MKKLLNEELNRKSIEEFKQAGKYPVIVVLDNIRSLNNIGSVFRTCDAFLLEGIKLCGITATPPIARSVKPLLGPLNQLTGNTLKIPSMLFNPYAMKDTGYMPLNRRCIVALFMRSILRAMKNMR